MGFLPRVKVAWICFANGSYRRLMLSYITLGQTTCIISIAFFSREIYRASAIGSQQAFERLLEMISDS